MTRKEAEERILTALIQIHDTYLEYHPNGDWLSLTLSRDYVRADNNFSYGGKDYDFPISISMNFKKGDQK